MGFYDVSIVCYELCRLKNLDFETPFISMISLIYSNGYQELLTLLMSILVNTLHSTSRNTM
jgi:hypothetical protein